MQATSAESTPPPVARRSVDHAGSPDRFGYEWATYRTILPESRGQLQRWLGSVELESFRGKRVLDVGCGMGRNPYWYLDAGAASLVAVDYDDRSVKAAGENLARFENAKVEKCSVYDLDPSLFGQFDRVTCVGVLHHLGDPDQALRKMWSMVRPGGDLILWCYAREGNRMMIPAIQALRAIGARAPIGVTHHMAKLVTLAAWPVLRLVPWRTEYYRTVGSLSFGNVESIIFDQMLPRIAHYWTQDDMRRLLEPLAGDVRLEFVQGNSWHARIQRRAG